MSKLRKALMLAALSTAPTRALVNARYRRLGMAARARFHADYAKLFTRWRPPIQGGIWHVDFANRSLRVPLRRATMWLDWDLAVSIVAHDPEIKAFYESLAIAGRPALFLDVGANYGTHAVLLASLGVDVVAFEPNAACIAYGRHLAAANELTVRWEHVAIGAREGEITLAYPAEATWLGTTTAALDGRTDLVRETVRLVPLDRFADLVGDRDVLIKIDVEGLELDVLEGAERLLARGVRLLFESNDATDRPALFDHLAARGYRVAAPPFAQALALDAAAFHASIATNFLAWRP